MKKKAAPVAGSGRQYWLFKSEPSVFGIDHLKKAARQTAPWDGVRNYQARNYLRDQVKVGDHVLFYHSSDEPLGIFGTMEVVRAGYPDSTAFDSRHKYYDAGSKSDQPRWYAVDVKLLRKFDNPVLRDRLAEGPVTSGMLVMKKGMRLSIQPVTEAEWRAVLKLAGEYQVPDASST
jgi:predicted RNA-binding protein with PUA-like domain